MAGRLRWRGAQQPPREGLGQEAERKGPGHWPKGTESSRESPTPTALFPEPPTR